MERLFRSRRRGVRRWLTVTTVVTVAALTATPSAAKPAQRVDVALEWWDVANTVMTPPAAPVGVDNFRAWAITWLAAARAVNKKPSPGPARHFREAAFAAAAHEALSTFVPARRAELDQALATTLGRIPDGRAETRGVAAGRAEARHVLADRQGDGLDNVSVGDPFTPPPPGPGVWEQTPPDFLPAQWPGMRDARPFALDRANRFRPGPPPALGSARYRADLEEIRAIGSVDSTVRTAEQTRIARFMQTAPPSFFHPAVRAGLQELSGNLERQAEFMAMVRIAFMDAMITVWDAKYTYQLWRPITAIRQAGADGDPLTAPDPNWTPLLATPPHPEYLSGHSGLMGAVVAAFKAFTGAGPGKSFTLTNPAMPGETLTYEYWEQMNQDMIDARVWVGFHFRSTDVVSADVGSRVTRYILHRSDQLFGC